MAADRPARAPGGTQGATVIHLPDPTACPACSATLGPVTTDGATSVCPVPTCGTASIATRCGCGAPGRMPMGSPAPPGWVRMTASTGGSALVCSDRCARKAIEDYVGARLLTVSPPRRRRG